MSEVGLISWAVLTVFSMICGIQLGKGLAFDNYKCTDERIENHAVVCYRLERKP